MAIGVRRDEEFSGTKPVEEHHRFGEARLDAWMRQNVDGYEGPLVVNQFKGGQSNLTYRLNTPGRSYVMRRKPFGKLLPSAHAVDREYRVIAALGNEGFPVAKAYALCRDDSIIGAAWELSTIGDPIADFTYLLLQWIRPGLEAVDLDALNIPSLEEATQAYCNVARTAVPDLNWYFAYNLFRLACIMQGIAGRVRDGTAASAKAIEYAQQAEPLSRAAWRYAQKAGA